MAEHSAVNGIVRNHAHIILRAVIHLTAAPFSMAPTPIIEPAMTCVVLTGIPQWAVPSRTMAEAVSAENPSIGRIFMILVPMVLTILQPPIMVPRDIAA